MTSTLDHSAPPDGADAAPQDPAAAFAERMFGAALGAIDLYTVYLGVRLGLYEALAQRAVFNASELAAAAGIDERYAREWLEQQTVTGVLDCADRDAPAAARRYSLPDGHARALLDADDPTSVAPLALALAGIGAVAPQLIDAYRRGTGVPYAAYGRDFRDGQAGFNRPAFNNLLAGEWLAIAAPDVHARLAAGEPVRVADVACGAGWSSIAIAKAYPAARVDGFDIDEASVSDARRNAIAAGVSDRVRFDVVDASDGRAPNTGGGAFDLVCVFEALHDMSRPVEALATVRRLAAERGTVIVMDERAADSFAESSGPIEAFLYGASVLHCLPVGRAEQPSAETGTVMRPDTMREYALAAGFSDVEVLPIEHDLYRFYRCVA